MLDEKTIEWLERRKNLCTHCGGRVTCCIGNKHNFNTTTCSFWEPFAGAMPCGILIQNNKDAAEFEARVSAAATGRRDVMLCIHCQYENDGCKSSNILHTRMESHWCRLKHARIAVEREMIAEGKGPDDEG